MVIDCHRVLVKREAGVILKHESSAAPATVNKVEAIDRFSASIYATVVKIHE